MLQGGVAIDILAVARAPPPETAAISAHSHTVCLRERRATRRTGGNHECAFFSSSALLVTTSPPARIQIAASRVAKIILWRHRLVRPIQEATRPTLALVARQ